MQQPKGHNVFETKGDRPYWQIIFDRLAGMEVNDLITYEQLWLLIPGASHNTIRNAFYKAQRELEDIHRRTLDCLRNTGYRVVEATEHERLARGHHRKARRSMGRAIRKAHSADRTRLAPADRRRIDAIEDHLTRQAGMIRRLDERIEKTEQRTAQTEKNTATLTDRVDELAALLRRHGIE